MLLVAAIVIAGPALLTSVLAVDCASDDECANLGSDFGQAHCAIQEHVCVKNCFVSVSPERSATPLGSAALLVVTITEPTGALRRSFKMNFSGSGTHFSKFYATQQSILVTLAPGESRQILVYFVAAEAGTKTVQVNAVDVDHSYIDLSQCTTFPQPSADVTVPVPANGRGGISSMMSLPGIDSFTTLVALAVIASVLCYSIQRKKRW